MTHNSRPDGWGRDELSGFLEAAFANQVATFANKPGPTATLIALDQCYSHLGKNLVNPGEILPAFLFLRTHSAFRGSCRLSMSGQVAESFAVLRSCIECSLYGLHIDRDVRRGKVWLHRQDNAASRREVQSEFSYRKVLKTLTEIDPDLAGQVNHLYQLTIDFGGHPNELAVTTNVSLKKDDSRHEYQYLALHGDSLPLDHALKATAQVGVGGLLVFRHVFKERMEILELSDKIDQLRSQL